MSDPDELELAEPVMMTPPIVREQERAETYADDAMWERYLIDRAEHEAHAWGDLPDDIEPDDHSEGE